MKICKKCNLEKEYDSFFKDKTKKDGYMNSCKECKQRYVDNNKELILEKKKVYYHSNRDLMISKNKKYYSNNKEKVLDLNRKSYLENREKKLEYQNSYYFSNKEKIQAYRKDNRDKSNSNQNNRYKNNSLYRLRMVISSVIFRSIRKGGYNKKSKTSDILGCSYEDFKIYIESLFHEGMTWENHGDWHLDHKIPISWANNEDEIIKLNHYSNFQPMWAADNQSKSNKYADI